MITTPFTAYAESGQESIIQNARTINKITNEINEVSEKITDIASHWAKKYIEKLINLETINGYPDGTFKPDTPMKVGEFSKILITSLGYTDIENSSKEHWSLNYVNKAKELYIISEGDFNISDLDRDINRGEIASMIIRSIRDERIKDLRPYNRQIKDLYKASIPTDRYIANAYGLGIITGYPDGEFKPQKTATRAEVSTIVVRMLDKNERKIPKIWEEEKEEEDNNKEERVGDDIQDTEFWREGIKAVKAYIKEQKDKNPNEPIYREEFQEKYNFTEKDIDEGFNLTYDFAMDMHNYSYKKDTKELREKLAKKYITSIDHIVNPMLINVWWDFAKAEKVVKKAIFVADKDCLYKPGTIYLRGRLYFKYENLKRLEELDMPYSSYYSDYLGRERFAENGKLYNVKEGKWYYKDMSVRLTNNSYQYHGFQKEDRNYHYTVTQWDKYINNFVEVSKDIQKELESYVEGK